MTNQADRSKPRPIALIRGLALSFAVPLVVFLAVLLLRPTRATKNWGHLPDRVSVDAPERCTAVTVRPVKRAGSEAVCSLIPAEDGPPLSSYTCAPRDSNKESWTLLIEVDTHLADPTCDLRLFFPDSPRGPIKPFDEKNEYPDVKCETERDRIACTLHSLPWRTYAVVLVEGPADKSRLAAQPILLAPIRQRGLNIQRESAILFLWQIALAGIAMAILYTFRPHGPRGLRWLGRARWRAISAVAGGGGAVSGLLLALRPPDLGGYDEPASWDLIISLPANLLVIAAVAGCLFDACRRWLMTRGRSPERWTIVAMVGIFAVLVPAQIREAHAINLLPYDTSVWPGFKVLFYCYFSLSIGNALLFCHEPAQRAQVERGTGAILPTRSSAARLFGCTILIGTLASVIGFTVGDIVNEPTAGQLISGFYKPAGTIGLLIVIAPLLVALALAINLGEERPAWAQELDACISDLANGVAPATRSRRFRRALELLIHYEREILSNARHLDRAAVVLLPLLRQYNKNDLGMLSKDVPTPDIEGRLTRAIAALERVKPQEAAVSSPLLLVDPFRKSLIVGKILVSAVPQPEDDLNIIVCRNGVPAHITSELADSVRGTVRHMVAVAGRDRDGRPALAGRTVIVDFCHNAMEFNGRSYELPLALALWALITRNEPAFVGWAATGTVEGSLEIGHVDDLDVKQHVLHGEHEMLIAPAPKAEEDARAATSVLERCILSDGGAGDVAMVAAEVREHLRGGGRAIVRVRTLGHAVALLFGHDL